MKINKQSLLGSFEETLLPLRFARNEFEPEPVRAELKECIRPGDRYGGIRRDISLVLGATYAIMDGDDDQVIERVRETALRALTSVLYKQVSAELLPAMIAVAHGKRGEAMDRLSKLMGRLSGADVLQ
jgi:hypothetical protein